MAQMLTERYAANLHGVLSCYDRIVITGTLPGVCYADGHDELSVRARHPHLRLPAVCRAAARAHARACAALAAEQARDRAHRQDPHPQGRRGGQGAGRARRCARPGACDLGDGGLRDLQALARQASGTTFLRPDTGKCLHYYFYFMDASCGCSTCACRPGARSACSSTATATAGWRASSCARASASLSRQRLRAHRRLRACAGAGRQPSTPTSCTAAWTATRTACARWPTCSGRPTTGA